MHHNLEDDKLQSYNVTKSFLLALLLFPQALKCLSFFLFTLIDC